MKQKPHTTPQPTCSLCHLPLSPDDFQFDNVDEDDKPVAFYCYECGLKVQSEIFGIPYETLDKHYKSSIHIWRECLSP